ncbi:hypothetical protein Agabi119p4_9733 [Agaricus bisporus var. burnettii]|uniref:Uncharacterized protein n=1 Tax=Agaricus bisporus var. burnettii TaxID=192524 RepID=A0A8H7EX37_AGABI|nr:hypothetical protein Agabi119p4_9733 [Agaricus bisporus var. burnettii]
MPFPPPEKVPDQDFSRVLDTLASLISQLPSEVPLTSEADTCFKEFLPPFRLDPDYFAKTEDEIATLGEQLERVFGFNTRSSGDGVLTIEERGPGLSAMHDVLVEYYHKYPSNMVHKKWIIDIANAVEQVYVHNNVPVPTRQMVEKVPGPGTSTARRIICLLETKCFCCEFTHTTTTTSQNSTLNSIRLRASLIVSV